MLYQLTFTIKCKPNAGKYSSPMEHLGRVMTPFLLGKKTQRPELPKPSFRRPADSRWRWAVWVERSPARSQPLPRSAFVFFFFSLSCCPPKGERIVVSRCFFEVKSTRLYTHVHIVQWFRKNGGRVIFVCFGLMCMSSKEMDGWMLREQNGR